jgi:U3 small nucleolar RNA-associated protein 21
VSAVRPVNLTLTLCHPAGAAQLRERDWANVVTAHAGDPAAYSWRLAHLALGDAVLGPPAGKRERGADPHAPAPATAVALSSCGNFALVGSAAGRVDRYNMQSGLHRGFYARCAARSASVLILGISAASAGWQGR